MNVKHKSIGHAFRDLLLAVALLSALLVGVAWAESGAFPCGPEPAQPVAPTTLAGCEALKMKQGCTPANPEPTAWYRVCCYSTPAGNCWQVWHRWQCCDPTWKNYYKKDTFINPCGSANASCGPAAPAPPQQ
jgi:hypothetical protein